MSRRYLLDTHVVLWWLRSDRKLGQRTRRLIENHDCSVSVVTLFELLAKNAAGKLSLPEGSLADQIEGFGFRLLSLTAAHVMSGAALTSLHPDPFDCLLLGIARSEQLSLLTRDGQLLERARPLFGELLTEA
jgi:PIN domain nuclease of toxin-antitoxin system